MKYGLAIQNLLQADNKKIKKTTRFAICYQILQNSISYNHASHLHSDEQLVSMLVGKVVHMSYLCFFKENVNSTNYVRKSYSMTFRILTHLQVTAKTMIIHKILENI